MTPDDSAPASDADGGPVASDEPVWYATAGRLPRRGQTVRVQTLGGHLPVARFEVVYAENWPAGASWVVGPEQHLPFGDVVAWAPDVDAKPPAPAPVAVPEPTPEGRPPPKPTALAVEISAEVERTKDVLRLLPHNLMGWSPHPDIPTLSTLALRTVRIAAWIGWMLALDELERSFEPDVPDFETVDQLFISYNATAEEVADLLVGLDGDRLNEPWRLLRNGALVAEIPRGNALRWYGLTPLNHHRAEVSITLRALDIHPLHLYPGWAFVDAVTGDQCGGRPAAPRPPAAQRSKP